MHGKSLMLLGLCTLPAYAEPALQATVIVEPDHPAGPVSPLLYGQFAEFMFEDIKGGLVAELVRGRGFEEKPNVLGLPRYWERDPDDRNDDDRMSFFWDEKTYYPTGSEGPQHALRIELKGDDEGMRRGIRQSGIPVRAGVRYEGYFWARAPQFHGSVQVALEADETGGERYAASEVRPVAGDWHQVRFSLTPNRSDKLAKLSILVRGQGNLWLDQVSLMPADAVDGLRADVMNRIRPLRPAFVRWPGGNVAQDYFWTWGIGPRDSRNTWVNLSWRNEPEPSDFGTDEYLQFCRRVGATPTLTVNVEGRGATPRLAADWVEYCNGPASSRWGAVRARNGHPQPYGVKIWEVGNEIWGSWVRGHSDAETYGNNFRRYAAAMKAVDPGIQLIAVGDNDMNWNRTVLGLTGGQADYLAVHHYYGVAEMAGDPGNLMARPLTYGRFYEQLRPLLPAGTRLAINEWNTSLPVPRQYSMESAVYAARMFNVFLRTRGLVAMSAVSDLVNGWSGGVIQASRHGVFVTPTYHVNAMYAAVEPRQLLTSSVQGPTFDTSREGKHVPVLDAVATSDAHGELAVHLVNSDAHRPVTVSLRGVLPREVAQLSGPPGSFNDWAHPAALKPRQFKLSSPKFTLPPQSVSVLKVVRK